LIRLLATLTALASPILMLFGCGPSYSPDTYANNAAQQAAKVETGVVAGVRPVQISAQGTVGAVAGAAAGGVAGSQVGVGPTSAFGAIGGSLIGGIAGVATEHIIGDTDGFEYVVRKANGDMISVAQKDKKPLWVGEKVLVISGPQARVVPDYTVPFTPPAKTAANPGPQAQPPAAEGAAASHPPNAAPASHPADGAPASHPADAVPASHPADAAPASHPPVAEVTPALPAEPAVPPRLPAAFGPAPSAPPPIITPPDVPPAPLASTPKP
jgi:outer membrane lipoprotein SlyB